jgi:nucleoside-diphosphate-sugar epimerase
VTTPRRDRRYLVVGGAGFVGSAVVRALRSEGARVVVVDNLLSANESRALHEPDVDFIHGSITDQVVLDQIDGDFEATFHLATYHGNQSSIANPLEDHANNTLPTLRLLEHYARIGARSRVVYSSAGCTVAPKTYNAPEATREEDVASLHLDSPYQISKIVGEMYAYYFHEHRGVDAVVARFQNVYGPGEVLGAGEWRGTPATVWRNVVPTFVYRALRGWPLRLDNGGATTRDFIFVDDVARGLLVLADRGASGSVYNLASGSETSIRELAETVNALVPAPAPLEIAPRRDWDNSGRRFGDPRKAEVELGFRAEVPFRAGIRRTVAWTQEHLAEIDASIARHRHLLPVDDPLRLS